MKASLAFPIAPRVVQCPPNNGAIILSGTFGKRLPVDTEELGNKLHKAAEADEWQKPFRR